MHRCNICRRPMQFDYVEASRITLKNEPVQYRNVKRYYCPEGCQGVRLDFFGASPVSSDTHTKVAPRVKPLQKELDFNDKLLIAGLVAGYVMFVIAILAIHTMLPLKIAAIAGLTIALFGVYRAATKRVVLPSYFPAPRHIRVEAPPVAAPVTTPAAAAPVAAAAAAPAAQTAVPATPLGSGIAMKVILDDGEHALDVGAGENMLNAALDRDVAVDFSCLEGLCDSCAVRVVDGLDNITPPTQEEIDMLGEDVQNGMRLACQVTVNGPVTIEQK